MFYKVKNDLSTFFILVIFFINAWLLSYIEGLKLVSTIKYKMNTQINYLSYKFV